MADETAIALAEMLTENTGRHMLDSGDAYGRNWERNQGVGVDMWLESPASWGYKGDYVSLSVFHFLNDRLTYDAELDAAFYEWASEGEMADSPWLECATAFAHLWMKDEFPDSGDDCWTTINSYNSEDSLDQVIQYVQIAEEGGEPIYGTLYLLQIHGGADVRGGYTRPRVFRQKNEYDEAPLLDNNNFTIYCDGFMPPQVETLPGFPNSDKVTHSWNYSHGECFNSDGDYLIGAEDPMNRTEWDEEEGKPFCPTCKELGFVSHLNVDPY